MQATIAAIATAPGEAGIGIVRLSGREAVAVADRVFRGRGGRTLAQIPARRLALGLAVDPATGEAIDEVLAVRMEEGRSYTGEATVELQAHGGPAVLEALLAGLLAAGARPAEPGEFTRRAFLAGRLDLSQAEAVAELVAAVSEDERRGALRQLRGEVGREVGAIREQILEALAGVEAQIDFSEEDGLTAGSLTAGLRVTAETLARLIARGRAGRLGNEGARAALVGRPNSGKSSLFNKLLDSDRAIVHPDPGTTRDCIECRTMIAGARIVLVDTAGIRSGAEGPEAEGIRRSLEHAGEAEIVLALVDGSEPLCDGDLELLAGLAAREPLVVVSKADLPRRIDLERVRQVAGGAALFPLSSRTGQGCAGLAEALGRRSLALLRGSGAEGAAPNARHREALEKAADCVAAAIVGLESPVPRADLAAADLREAVGSLGLITGDSVSEAVLDRIFSRFCVGK